MSRPRVRDGEMPIFERVFQQVSELKGHHDGVWVMTEKGSGMFVDAIRFRVRLSNE